MAKAKGKGASAGTAPEKQAQGETYKGWSATKDGPIALNDDLRAKIDEYHTYEPSEAEDIYAALEEAGLVYDGEERNTLRNRLSTLETWGWDGKDGVVFTDAEAEEIGRMIATWADADDVAAGDLEAVLIQRGLVKPKDAAEKRAERGLDKLGWTFVREQDTKKGKVVELGYHGEKGGQKTATLPTLVEVLAAVRVLEGKAVPSQPAATSAPASPAPAPSATGSAATTAAAPSTSGSAAGDAHAESALNATSATWAKHLELKEKVRAAEERANRRDATIAGLVAELEDEIAHICGVDEDDLDGSWLDDDVKMDGIHGLRAKLAEKRHTIRRLTGAADLEHAKEELAEFEKSNPLFTQKAPAPKPVVPEKPKDKLDQAVADVAKPAPEKPKSEGAKKLEALLASPPPIQPADLTQETKKQMADHGFRWCGKTSAPIPSRAQFEERLVGYGIALEKKQKHRLTELRDGFAAWGWEFVEPKAGEKHAPAPVAAGAAV